jgi:hypothetical protein
MTDYQLMFHDAVLRNSDGAVIPNDEGNRDWLAYREWLAAGNVPNPYIPPASPVPTQVTMRQARLALNAAGLLSAVQAAVDAGDEATKINWEYASAVDRNDALVTTLAPAIGLTSAQLDALFTQAASF